MWESMEVFNYLSNTWSRLPDYVNLPLPLAWMEMELINNVVYTVGGYGLGSARGKERSSYMALHNSYSTDNLFALDLGNLGEGWKELSPMSTERDGLATVSYHSKYF